MLDSVSDRWKRCHGLWRMTWRVKVMSSSTHAVAATTAINIGKKVSNRVKGTPVATPHDVAAANFAVTEKTALSGRTGRRQRYKLVWLPYIDLISVTGQHNSPRCNLQHHLPWLLLLRWLLCKRWTWHCRWVEAHLPVHYLPRWTSLFRISLGLPVFRRCHLLLWFW